MGLSFVPMSLRMPQLLLLAFSRMGNFSQEPLYVAITGYGLGGPSIVFSIMSRLHVATACGKLFMSLPCGHGNAM